MDFILIQTTFKSRAECNSFIKNITNSKLVADVHVSKVVSHYTWNCKKIKSKEFELSMKTCASNFAHVEQFIKNTHTYVTPQIIATPITHCSKEFADWIKLNIVCK